MEPRDNSRSNMIFFAGVAVLMAGAGLIYTVTSEFGMPGMKYLLMTPFLAIVAYVMNYYLTYRFLFTRIGIIFAGVMVFVNVYMGLAILSSGLLTDLVLLNVRTRRSVARIAGMTYPIICVLSSMLIARYMIGGRFTVISTSWLVLAGLIGLITSGVGVYMAMELVAYINKKSWTEED